MLNLKEKSKELFDDDFNVKTTNIEDLIEFCNLVTEHSKIQVCTPKGQMYEYLPRVCRSVVNSVEM